MSDPRREGENQPLCSWAHAGDGESAARETREAGAADTGSVVLENVRTLRVDVMYILKQKLVAGFFKNRLMKAVEAGIEAILEVDDLRAEITRLRTALAAAEQERDHLRQLRANDCKQYNELSERYDAAEQRATEAEEKVRGLAVWIRAPGNINRDDAIDECARAVENLAETLKGPQA